MKHFRTLATATALALFGSAALAQDPPKFYKDTYPAFALESRFKAEKALMGDGAQLDAKTRELVALGVAAQIPCQYCVYFHNKMARAAGASESEVREAVAMAAHVRHWSTVLNGMAYDFAAFKDEADALLSSQ